MNTGHRERETKKTECVHATRPSFYRAEVVCDSETGLQFSQDVCVHCGHRKPMRQLLLLGVPVEKLSCQIRTS